MKKILFFENSVLLHKVVKLVFSNASVYNFTIVENLADFEKLLISKDFDMIISHIDLFILTKFKNKNDIKNILLMHEKSDSLDDFKGMKKVNFIEKPFLSKDFKKMVDSILGIENSYEENIIMSFESEKVVQEITKETVEKWLKEQAPYYAKEVIREEILKLIS